MDEQENEQEAVETMAEKKRRGRPAKTLQSGVTVVDNATPQNVVVKEQGTVFTEVPKKKRGRKPKEQLNINGLSDEDIKKAIQASFKKVKNKRGRKPKEKQTFDLNDASKALKQEVRMIKKNLKKIKHGRKKIASRKKVVITKKKIEKFKKALKNANKSTKRFTSSLKKEATIQGLFLSVFNRKKKKNIINFSKIKIDLSGIKLPKGLTWHDVQIWSVAMAAIIAIALAK